VIVAVLHEFGRPIEREDVVVELPRSHEAVAERPGDVDLPLRHPLL
jgi:hypothetical protein